MSVNIKVDLNNPVQTDFLGNNAVYHGYAGMPDKDGRVYNDELCEIEADRAAALGLRITRTFYKWWAWDSNTDTWDWDNEVMTAFYKWLKRMKDRNIQVALNTGWCMPGDVNEVGGFNGKSPFKVEGNWMASVKKYAEWVSETLHQLIEVRGFTNITYIHLFTEPQYGTKFNYQIDNKHAYELWFDCAKAVTEQLIADGRRNLVKIIGPNEGSTATSIMNKWVAENADEYVDVYSSHNYQDFIVDEAPDKIPGKALVFNMPGARVQQEVSIEPNTNYVMETELSATLKDKLTASGNVVIGAWSCERLGNYFSIESGGQPTGRLNEKSTTLIDVVDLSYEKKKFSFTFNSGDASKCVIGIFSDLKGEEDKLKAYSCTLKKEGRAENIFLYPDLTEIRLGYGLFNCPDPIEYIPLAWRNSGCSKENAISDPYYHLGGCAKTTINYVPKNKPVWFDEYNVRAEKDSYHTPIHGTHLAASMQSLMNSGIQSSLMWTLFDQQWPNNHCTNNDCFVDGDHRCGIMPVLTRSLVPHPGYYAVALVMKFMGGDPGTYIYEGEGKNLVHATVSKMPDGNFSVLVINNKLQPDEFSIDFSEIVGLKLNRYVYDPETIVPDETATLIESDSVFEVQNKLSDKLPAGAVAVYTTY
ncbi:MAG: hypothetical protein E7551_00715 [Ruminococcaceae bacterium]|nr:hypothetical protein [Oscillospiraceae bacterium]